MRESDHLAIARARVLAFGRSEDEIQRATLAALERYNEAVNAGDYEDIAARIREITELGAELDRLRWAKGVYDGSA